MINVLTIFLAQSFQGKSDVVVKIFVFYLKVQGSIFFPNSPFLSQTKCMNLKKKKPMGNFFKVVVVGGDSFARRRGLNGNLNQVPCGATFSRRRGLSDRPN
jgi:hypothetical protein